MLYTEDVSIRHYVRFSLIRSQLKYCILLIVCGKKVLLFFIFIFIPEKFSRLPAVTSFHRIYVYSIDEKNLQLQSNPQKT